MPIKHSKNKNLAPSRRMDCETLFWGPFFILLLTLLLIFFLLHPVQTLENCMSMRMILNNAIIFICKYAKM